MADTTFNVIDDDPFIDDDPRIGCTYIGSWQAIPDPDRNPSGSRTGPWCVTAGEIPDEQDVWLEVTGVEYPQDLAEFIAEAVKNEYARQPAAPKKTPR